MKLTYTPYRHFTGPLPSIPRSPAAQIVALEETICDLVEALMDALGHDNYDGILDDYIANECHAIADRSIHRSVQRWNKK